MGPVRERRIPKNIRHNHILDKENHNMRKYQVVISILTLLLIVISIASIANYREKRMLEDQHREQDIKGSFSVMMLVHSELSRFISMYEREDLTQDLLDEHRNVLWNICNTSTHLEGSRSFNNIRYIVVQDISEVNEELYMTYVELADYLFSIYLGIPEPYEIDGEVLSDEREYLYEVFTSDEHTKEIQRIVELD